MATAVGAGQIAIADAAAGATFIGAAGIVFVANKVASDKSGRKKAGYRHLEVKYTVVTLHSEPHWQPLV
jgi:hypothetical protein